jgi:hypothetical protein
VPKHAKPFTHTLSVPVALHEPAPSQAKSVSVPLDLHDMLHFVVAAGYWQALPFGPSHLPPQVVPAPAQIFPAPTGGPEGTVVLQVPCTAGRLHAWHTPVHAVSQQTESTQ